MPIDLPSPEFLKWIALLGFLTVLFIVDLAVVRGRGGEMSTRTAAKASAIWLALALLFGLGLWAAGDATAAKAYFAGYLVEKSLSLDNVFVFLLVFSAFGIAAAERHRLLSYGIAFALVLRGVFIVAGAALLESFSWTSFVFAAILLGTAWKMWSHRHDHDSETALVGRIRERLPSASPALAALVAIVLVDLLFAVDSVPAILAITSDAYIVVAANAFALLGLRPLFFLVADLVERLYYLKAALAGVLAFVGLKLIIGELVGKVGPEISLPVIAAILAAGVAASVIRERRRRPTPQGA